MALTALEAANVLCAAARLDPKDVVKTCFHRLDDLRRLLEPTIVQMMSADVHTLGDVARRDNLRQSAIDECERLHRLHFAPVQDADAISHEFADTVNGGRASVDDWECSAIALQDIYEQRHKRFPDECLLITNDEPVSRHTPRLHLARFQKLNQATRGQKKSTGELRKLLYDQCKDDLDSAGLVAISTDGFTNAEHEPTHWIFDMKQLERIKTRINANSVRRIPVELLKRIQFQIDHNDPSCYYGKRGALHSGDVLVNFTLTPRWLNLLPQWKDGFCSAKIAYMGYVGYQLFRLYRVAVACGPEVADRVNRDLDGIFSRGDTCFREDILTSAWKRIGRLRKSPGFAARLITAVQAFASNAIHSDRGQRRINAMFKRTQVQIDTDLGGPSTAAIESGEMSIIEEVVVEPVAKRQKVDAESQTDTNSEVEVGVVEPVAKRQKWERCVYDDHPFWRGPRPSAHIRSQGPLSDGESYMDPTHRHKDHPFFSSPRAHIRSPGPFSDGESTREQTCDTGDDNEDSYDDDNDDELVPDRDDVPEPNFPLLELKEFDRYDVPEHNFPFPLLELKEFEKDAPYNWTFGSGYTFPMTNIGRFGH
jgi:hypothetical protein